MSYLKFNQDELVNLEYSLKKEILATSRTGGYASTTAICCNTRKYHGLLIVPIEEFGWENHVLLSALDETVIQHGQEFNLALRKYPDVYEPRGHKYITDLSYEPILSLTYRVGGVKLRKDMMLVHNENQILIRYTLEDAHSDTRLRLRPFLAFRNIHSLSKANMEANTRYTAVANGISSRLYKGFPALNMQTSRESTFVPSPDWYYNVCYSEEMERGYDYMEDLFVPGYFELDIKKGESIVFSASTEAVNPAGLARKFNTLKSRRKERTDFRSCMEYSAGQFIVRNGKDTEIVAGYPWFGRWGRDTFISLPGLTLYGNHDPKSFRAVMDTMVSQLRKGLFPNIGKGESAAYNSIDAPLWFFWAMQKYGEATGAEDIWKNYSSKMKSVLDAFTKGVNEGIGTDGTGLIRASVPGKALTWMDAVVDGIPVTPRAGYAVEINALWYNAICYCLELAEKAADTAFVEKWKPFSELVAESFVKVFWDEDMGYLADYVNDDEKNMYVRPNQIFACSLQYSPLDDRMKSSVLNRVTAELLTPKGLRTLSPKNPLYRGHYGGNQKERDSAYHQGTVWPWLTGAYIEASLKLYGKQFIPEAERLLEGYEEDMNTYGIGSVPEIYDGDPSHNPCGCISQAWSVAEILRSISMLDNCRKNK